ncbi:MAG: type II toxin-antitoxin system VapC family toxin [Cyanobium sp.]
MAWDGELADQAADAFARFGKGRHASGLNFGDCFSYALAERLKVPLLFVGNGVPSLRRLASAVMVPSIALTAPATQGPSLFPGPGHPSPAALPTL